MADVPRILNNTYYQKQNHLRLAKNERNKQVIFSTAVSRLALLGFTVQSPADDVILLLDENGNAIEDADFPSFYWTISVAQNEANP